MVQHVKVPANGAKITVNRDFTLNVPDNPIIPYIEGDGTGFDITPVMIKVVDAAVAKAYGGKKKIQWIRRLPPYAFATAASTTLIITGVMSKPVPSPSM